MIKSSVVGMMMMMASISANVQIDLSRERLEIV